MPNPIQYRQTSLGKACYEKPLENRIRSHGVGACVTSVGAAQTCCLWETNVALLSPTSSAIALQTILKPTSPYCRQLRLLLLQTNLKTTPLCCHQTYLLKQTHFEANATLHFVSTYYCLPRASCCLQLCLTVSKNVLLLTKYWEYLPSGQIMSLVFL